MYRKDTALELQFSSSRLNDAAGDPFWIDLTGEEAARLRDALQTHLSCAGSRAMPLVISLDQSTGPPEAGHDAPFRRAALRPAGDEPFRQWICLICGWIYDESAGSPEHGIAPGTRWNDVPADWRCPLCDVGKDDFALVEF